MEGSEYKKVIGCNKKEVKRKGKITGGSSGGCNNGTTLLPTGFLYSHILYTQQIQNDTEQYITGHKCVFGLISAQFSRINRPPIQLRV